jgi:hypothetical protein
MELYVQFAQEELPRTVASFIKKYYTKRVDPYIAIGHNTFFDPECTKLHCSKSYRSFDDLYDLVKTYYPDTTKKEMIHHLITVNIPTQNGRSFPNLGTCNTMNRIRFIPYQKMNDRPEHLEMKMLHSENTWMELLGLIGIKSEKELQEYIKNNREP